MLVAPPPEIDPVSILDRPDVGVLALAPQPPVVIALPVAAHPACSSRHDQPPARVENYDSPTYSTITGHHASCQLTSWQF